MNIRATRRGKYPHLHDRRPGTMWPCRGREQQNGIRSPAYLPHSHDRRQPWEPETGVKFVLACTLTRHFHMCWLSWVRSQTGLTPDGGDP